MISSILSDALRIYRERFGAIVAIIIVIDLPCNLLRSYMYEFVFEPSGWIKHLFDLLFPESITVISTASVIAITMGARSGKFVTFGNAVRTGLARWGLIWWAWFLSLWFVVISLFLFVIPSLYVAVRISFVCSVAMVEGVSGSNAIRRSFEITRGRFWEIAGLCALTMLVPSALWFILWQFTPLSASLRHWPIQPFAWTIFSIIAAFQTVALQCAYEVFSKDLLQRRWSAGAEHFELNRSKSKPDARDSSNTSSPASVADESGDE